MKRDRRIERTHELIFNAFLQMVVEKGYVNVSVQDIVESANVGRSTFYTHFDSKEDLLSKSLGNLFTELFKQMPESERGTGVPALGIFMHLQDASKLKEAFDLDFIAQKFHEQLQLAIVARLTRNPTHTMTRSELVMYSHMLAGSVISLMVWWVKSGMRERPEDMAQHFSRYCTVLR